MTDESTSTSRSLSVLLLKGDTDNAIDFIRPDKVDSRLGQFRVAIGSGVAGNLFVRSTDPLPPRWAAFFDGQVLPDELGLVSSSAGVLIVRIRPDCFALTFGYGLNLLLPDRVVEGFGLRCTLNAVDAEALRSIDKETFDAVASQSRLQSSRGAGAGEFGIDVERDLLKAVTGKPRDESLGQRLSGRDALAITTRVTLKEVPSLLTTLHKVYRATTYTNNFRWVDDVRRITDEPLTEQLDSQLFSAVESEDYSNSWLAPPDVLEWADVRYFSYSNAERTNVFTDIHWRTLARNIRTGLSRNALKRRRIYCYGEDDRPLRYWVAYNCIYAQIDFQGGTYLLTGGSWYRVASDFVEEVDSWFQAFPKTSGALPIYDHDSEGAYNKFVADSSGGHYALLDKQTLRYGRGRSRIEFCDLLGSDGEIVHVKRYLGSSGLSHLFAQGLVSGTLLRVDSKFRGALRKVVPAAHFQSCRLSKDMASGRRITFAIIYRSKGEFVLPFFSKISLRRLSQSLQGFGYNVQLCRIAMDEVRARMEKPKSQAL